jgi:hypothetical protein
MNHKKILLYVGVLLGGIGWVGFAVVAVLYFGSPREYREYSITITDGESTKVQRAPADSITIADGKMTIIGSGNKLETPIEGRCINIR